MGVEGEKDEVERGIVIAGVGDGALGDRRAVARGAGDEAFDAGHAVAPLRRAHVRKLLERRRMLDAAGAERRGGQRRRADGQEQRGPALHAASRVAVMIQFVSHVAPPSTEKACCQTTTPGVVAS